MALRGSSQVIYDLYDHPEEVHRLIDKLTAIFLMVINKMAEVTGPFHGGYFIEQFALWAPGRLIRLQEDASALYSPELFREFLQGPNRTLAGSAPYSLIHLHSSSLFLLEDILAIDELTVIQINKDVGGMPVPQMMPYLKMVQDAGKCLIIRGCLDHEDLALFREHCPNWPLLADGHRPARRCREVQRVLERLVQGSGRSLPNLTSLLQSAVQFLRGWLPAPIL